MVSVSTASWTSRGWTRVRQHIRRPSGLRRPGRRAREPFVAPKTRVPWFTSQGHLAPLVDRRNQGLPEAVRSGPLLRLSMRRSEASPWGRGGARPMTPRRGLLLLLVVVAALAADLALPPPVFAASVSLNPTSGDAPSVSGTLSGSGWQCSDFSLPT